MNIDEQSFSFMEFLESKVDIKDVWTVTLLRWLREDMATLTSQQWYSIEREVLKRKGMSSGG